MTPRSSSWIAANVFSSAGSFSACAITSVIEPAAPGSEETSCGRPTSSARKCERDDAFWKIAL